MTAHSTPAYRVFGLNFDAGVSKELIPVRFSRTGAGVSLPELELTDAVRAS